MKWENRGSRSPTAPRTAPPRRPAEDRQGVGGFYEAIMAMMVVTAGVVLLACSLTFLAIGDEERTDLRAASEDIAASLLDNRTICPSERMVDLREAGRADWASIRGEWEGGMAVFITLPDGSSSTLYRDEGSSGAERGAVSEPVNAIEHGGIVTAGLLTVWVWE